MVVMVVKKVVVTLGIVGKADKTSTSFFFFEDIEDEICSDCTAGELRFIYK